MFTKSRDNLGSLCRIRIIEESAVTEMAPDVRGVISQPIIVTGNWREIKFSRDTAHFVERTEHPFYNLTVNFRVAQDNANNLQLLEELERKKWIVELTDLNGVVKIAGRPGEACVIVAELRDNGQNKRDSNHYNCAIMLKRRTRVPIAVF